MDTDSKQYNKIFNNKKLSWNKKLERATEYAKEQIEHRTNVTSLGFLLKGLGMMPISFN